MTSVRDHVAHFLKDEGHRVDVSAPQGGGVAELLFRTRGQVYSVTTNEHDAATFTIATAYEVPEFARNQANGNETLTSAQREFPEVDFAIAHDGALFVASIQATPGSPEAFTKEFWGVVARVREAGTYAIERVVDRSESKAAADKFIKSLKLGER